MAKNLKLNIKNAQIAQAIDLGGLKKKLSKKKEEPAQESTEAVAPTSEPANATAKEASFDQPKEEAPRVRARTKSAFAEPALPIETRVKEAIHETPPSKSHLLEDIINDDIEEAPPKRKTGEELRKELFGDEEIPSFDNSNALTQSVVNVDIETETDALEERVTPPIAHKPTPPVPPKGPVKHVEPAEKLEKFSPVDKPVARTTEQHSTAFVAPPSREKLGPTGRHVNDLLPRRREEPKAPAARNDERRPSAGEGRRTEKESPKPKPKIR